MFIITAKKLEIICSFDTIILLLGTYPREIIRETKIYVQDYSLQALYKNVQL